MGGRGPAPKAPTVKIADGTYRQDRDGNVIAAPGEPEMPGYLDDEARAEWRRAVAELLPLGVLSTIDRTALAAYCEAWSDYRAARLAVRGVPAVAVNTRGSETRSAAWRHLDACRDAWLRLAQHMGLTPQSRNGMRVLGKGKASDGAVRRRSHG